MVLSFWVCPAILLVAGQSFDILILGLGVIILTVVFGLTAFIFIRLFINWVQGKIEEKRQRRRQKKRVRSLSINLISKRVRNTSQQTTDKLDNYGGNVDLADSPIDRVIQIPIIYDNPAKLERFYKPIALWHGRSILPAQEKRLPYGAIFFEVTNAPKKYQNLIGETVILKFSTNREVQFFIHAVTQDIYFTRKAKNSQKSGNIHPERLNGLRNVGPLETLAGTRLEDSVTAMLRRPVIVINRGSTNNTDNTDCQYELIIDREPVQITGRSCALVTILQRQSPEDDRFIVRHFDRTSQQFNGAAEIICIPQIPPDKNGVARFNNHLIERSPLNTQGWYIYGERDRGGTFVVRAIEPRKVTSLIPDETHFGLPKCLDYLNTENWQNTAAQKGTAKIVLLSPHENADNSPAAFWQEGDTGIVIHCFGGIGGKKGEKMVLGIATGHFAFGVAKVVRDRFSGELRFDIEYKQVYAHNPDGIVAGSSKWQSYMGDLERGWLGDRPVCDIICKLDSVCRDYDFNGIKLSPLDELNQQLDIMMARYRSGDGTGASLVTPATSCVQDSSQAIYATIKKITAEVESNPQIQDWLKANPTDAQTQRFDRLVALGNSLEKVLVPLGIVRPDWHKNAQLAGIDCSLKPSPFAPITHPIKAFISYRTMLPRRTQDEIAKILLKQGEFLWVIRTNQVGGFDPDIEPIAPTGL